jgi:2-(1,2-epoxy-1,2-dihydrophenyl)acetyl-CoA isomerase
MNPVTTPSQATSPSAQSRTDSTADAPAVLCEQDAGVLTITLNRPKVLNAMNNALLDGLSEGISRAKNDPTVRAVMITGRGAGFCAGADLNSLSSQTDRDVEDVMRQRYHPVILAIRQCGKPVVAAVNGTAAGGGMSLALACDIVVAAESATFLQAFGRIGLVPDCGSTWLLPRLVGDARARALILLADRIPAREALDYGLIWKVVADEHLAEEARTLTARLAAQPTLAMQAAKQALAVSGRNGLGDQLELEALLQRQLVRTEDHREGVRAFLEKRPAVFQGR